MSANNLDAIAHLQGDYPRAVGTHIRAIAACQKAHYGRSIAVALGMVGKTADAEATLRDVIDRATAHQRPLLVAVAQRDLAQILAREGQVAAAKEVARTARAFERLGAKAEIGNLDALLGTRD